MLCQFKNILGIPNQGVHEKRIFGFSLFDIVGTVLAAYIVSKYSSITFIKSSIVLFIIGTLLHILFCVDTTFVKMIT